MASDKKPTWSKIRIRQSVQDLRQYGPCIEVTVSAALGDHLTVQALALLDSGAHSTGISPRLMRRLNLRPFTEGLIHEAGREPIRAPMFYICVSFPSFHANGLAVAGLPSLAPPHDVVVGRDVLANCRLLIDFGSGATRLHFKYP